MPYFAWKGVNLHAQVSKGTYFANSQAELDSILFKKGIALIACKSSRLWSWPVKYLNTKLNYFSQITMLLKAGMLLPDALSLVASHYITTRFAPMAYDIAHQVTHGISFHHAICRYPKIFNTLDAQLILVGQESGSLTESLEVLSHHLESFVHFKAKIKSALILPLVTFCFFLFIIAIILIVIVPQFVTLFASMHIQIPAVTNAMIVISEALRSYFFVMIVACLPFLYYAIAHFLKKTHIKKHVDYYLMKFPLSRAIIWNKAMAGYFQSIALLMRGGMPFVKALKIAQECIGNHSIKNELKTIEYEVNAGNSFASVLAAHEHLFEHDIIALIKVGQESSMLMQICQKVSEIYQARLLQTLNRINTLFQPFLLIILGLMITALILALYSPIMSLSYAL